jgi:hypothetical protein
MSIDLGETLDEAFFPELSVASPDAIWLGINTDEKSLILSTADKGESWSEVNDGVYFNGEGPIGLLFDVAADGTGWLVSVRSGMLLRRVSIAAGDVNSDGRLDSGDLLGLVKALVNETDPTGNADCNQDGKKDAGDLICIIKKLEQGN